MTRVKDHSRCDMIKILICLRINKRLGFIPPFVRRANYFHATKHEEFRIYQKIYMSLLEFFHTTKHEEFRIYQKIFMSLLEFSN
jgi:hypothetical protein